MAERIQDSGQLPIAHSTPENPHDSFGIRNFYNPDSLYALFTRDYKSHSLSLTNNWKKVKEQQYDPIAGISASVVCDLKYKYDRSTRSRNEKVIFITGSIYTTDWDHLRRGMDENLEVKAALGVEPEDVINWNSQDFQAKIQHKYPYGTFDKYFHPDNYEKEVRKQFILLWQRELLGLGLDLDQANKHGTDILFQTNGVEPRMALSLSGYFGGIFGQPYGESHFAFGSTYPEPLISLSQPEDVDKLQKSFFSGMEKIIRGIYKLQEKDLPPLKLEFKPEVEKSMEFLAECTYCSRQYFAGQSLACPGCGASAPHFVAKD